MIITPEIQEIIDAIKESIEHHEKMKNSYFFNPPSNASGRRSYEKNHSFIISFTYNDKKYKYWSDCTCSCKNIYFKDGFVVDGQKKDVRAFKKVIKELEEMIDDND